MSSTLPKVRFREYQVQTLSSFISCNPSHSASNLFIQGYEGSGKSYTVSRFFQCNPDLISVTLRPPESVTSRLLLQSMARSILFKLIELYPHRQEQLKLIDPLSIEEPFHLILFLEKLFKLLTNEKKLDQLFIIFDGLDSLQDIDVTLLLKLLKLDELVMNSGVGVAPGSNTFPLKLIYIVRDPRYVDRYSSFNIPTIVFPQYDYDQVLEILIMTRYEDMLIDLNTHLNKECEGLTINKDISSDIVINFITLIVQAFQMYTGNNVNVLNDLADLKWESYLNQIDDTNYINPVAIYKKSIHLFTSTNDTLTAGDDEEEDTNDRTINEPKNKTTSYELSTIAKYLLIAAYFCSYIEPKYEASIFSKRSNTKTGRGTYGRRHKMETNPRNLQPSVFLIERLLAIFQAIYPVEYIANAGSLQSLLEEKLMKSTVEVFQNFAELYSLKLISTTASGSLDLLSQKTRWKVNVPWEIIHEVASSVGFDIAQYFSGVSDY